MLETNLLPLNRDEVLAHLTNILGSDLNISDSQLKIFMHQLRRLIMEDLKEQSANKENRSDSTVCRCHSNCEIYNQSFSSLEKNSESVCREQNYSHVEPKNDQNLVKKTSSAFIKPWRLRKTPSATPRNSLKTDPVTLHQHYQQYWNQHRVPGESKHADLRWRVREKMLGEDPQPRTNEDEEICMCDCCSKVGGGNNSSQARPSVLKDKLEKSSVKISKNVKRKNKKCNIKIRIIVK